MATPNLPQYEIIRRQYLAADPELKRLNQQQAQTRGQLYAAPFQAREQYQNIFNPLEREKLISQAVGNVLGQLGGFNDLVSQRQGRADQLTKLATDYQAEQNAIAEGKAKQQQQDFENQIALAKLGIDRARLSADKNKYDANMYTDLFLKGRVTESQIPQEIRESVLGTSDIFKASPVGKYITGFVEQLRGGVNPGTREELIDKILASDPSATYEDVANTVYTYIPDDIESGLKANIQSDKTAREKLYESFGLKG